MGRGEHHPVILKDRDGNVSFDTCSEGHFQHEWAGNNGGKRQHPQDPSTCWVRGTVRCPVLSCSILQTSACSTTKPWLARAGEPAGTQTPLVFCLVPHPFHHVIKLHAVVSADGRHQLPAVGSIRTEAEPGQLPQAGVKPTAPEIWSLD